MPPRKPLWRATLATLACLGTVAAPLASADPSLLYSTYLGGNHWEEGLAVASDAAGNTYVAGHTFSADFPTEGPSQPLRGISDAFVAKLDPAGRLLFSLRLGGSGSEQADGIAVDSAGNIWITGFTDSPDFPRVRPVGPPVQAGDTDAFVVQLAPDGSSLLLATTLGGTGFDQGKGVAVDELGYVSIVGATRSTDFPIRGTALQPTAPGGLDGFLARLAPDGTLACATYLGGSGDDQAHGVAIGGTLGVQVAGTTSSPDLRIMNASQSFLQGRTDAFYYRLRDCGLVFSKGTYLGGSGDEEGLAIASDETGGVRVAGSTTSPDLPHRLTGTSLQGPRDAFVALFRNDGFHQWTAYLGGSTVDMAEGVAVGPGGETTVAGLTYSLDFPVAGALQDRCAPEWEPGTCLADAFVTRIDRNGGIVWSTYLGGSEGSPAYPGEDGARAVAIDPAGNAYVTGWTYSVDFPTVNAFQPKLSPVGEGEDDAFITKIVLTRNQAPDCSAATADPSVIWPPNGKMVPVSVAGLTDPDGDPLEVVITAIHQDEPLSGLDPDASGVATATAMVRATRAGQGDGRVYCLGFRASDPEGFTCSGEVAVCVPHDKRSGGACGDGGATVDSTSPRPRASALVWSTWLGGRGDEVKLADVEVDASGHAWIAGTTASEDYPVRDGEPPYGYDDEYFFLDAFISRLGPDGSLVRSGYGGGPFSNEFVEDLALDPNGVAWLGAWYETYEDEEVLAGRVDPAGPFGGNFSIFIGEGFDAAYAVATDRQGNAYLAGSSGSEWFPGIGRYFPGGVGNYVLKLGPDRRFLDIFLLPERSGGAFAIALDEAGNLYMSGSERPSPFGLDEGPGVWVLKLDPAGNLLWKAALGGRRSETATSIAVDAAGRAWVAGWTESPDFPVRGGRLHAGGSDAFLVRLTPGGVLDLSTLLGGSGTDQAHDLALDTAGRPYLAGLTASADFPRAGALPGSCGDSGACGSGSDAFAAAFDIFGSSGLGLTFSTRLGGGSSDEAYGVAVDPSGSFLWVAGLTRSTDFPARQPWQPALAGEGDAFVSKLALGSPGKGSR